MNLDTVHIGIIGAGSIVRQRHLPRLQNIPGVNIVAVCNRRRETAKAMAKVYGIPRVVESWQDLVAMKDLDAVVIGTWPYLHHDATISALSAGKHVFCQARMAMNFNEAKEMYDKSLETGLKAMLCPPPVGLYGDYVMRELIEGKYLGQIYNIVIRAMGSSYADPRTPLHWRQIEKLSGINTLTVGIYAEVIRRWFGDTHRVMAQAKLFIPERRDPDTNLMAKVDRPDSVIVISEMENDALASYYFSGVSCLSGPNLIEVYGSDGTLIYNVDADQIHGAKASEEHLQPIPIPESRARLWTVEQDFIAAIREDRPISPSFYDGLKYMEFTEAVFLSVCEERAVYLPLEQTEHPQQGNP